MLKRVFSLVLVFVIVVAGSVSFERTSSAKVEEAGVIVANDVTVLKNQDGTYYVDTHPLDVHGGDEIGFYSIAHLYDNTIDEYSLKELLKKRYNHSKELIGKSIGEYTDEYYDDCDESDNNIICLKEGTSHVLRVPDGKRLGYVTTFGHSYDYNRRENLIVSVGLVLVYGESEQWVNSLKEPNAERDQYFNKDEEDFWLIPFPDEKPDETTYMNVLSYEKDYWFSDGGVHKFKYNKKGLLINDGSFKYKYNRHNLISSATYFRKKVDWQYIFEYDTLGRKVSCMSITDGNKDDPRRWYMYKYDKKGRVKRINDYSDFYEKVKYDKKGRVYWHKHHFKSVVTTVKYDKNGNVLSERLKDYGKGKGLLFKYKNTYKNKRLVSRDIICDGKTSKGKIYKYKRIRVYKSLVKQIKRQQWALINGNYNYEIDPEYEYTRIR